ncbi:MAG: Fic family protein, partial [Veillonellales bacterium]
PEEIKELDAYFKIGLTYSSNALEGNTLTISETKVLLEDGLTAGGKPLKDSLEAIGHANAYDFMLQIVRKEPFKITEHIILELHRLLYEGIDKQNAGKYRDIAVYITGTDYLPPEPEQVPQLMKEYVNKVNQLSGKVHPIELAALAHKWLVDIHPYVEGNGRTARLLMNLLLMHYGYGIVSIPPVLRLEYIEALCVSQRANQPDAEPLIKLIAECTLETQRDYCRLLRIKVN